MRVVICFVGNVTVTVGGGGGGGGEDSADVDMEITSHVLSVVRYTPRPILPDKSHYMRTQTCASAKLCTAQTCKEKPLWRRAGDWQFLDRLVLQILNHNRTVLIEHRKTVPCDPHWVRPLATAGVLLPLLLANAVQIVRATVERRRENDHLR